jgi:hypothetical protein
VTRSRKDVPKHVDGMRLLHNEQNGRTRVRSDIFYLNNCLKYDSSIDHVP